jgi:hypothetical protein
MWTLFFVGRSTTCQKSVHITTKLLEEMKVWPPAWEELSMAQIKGKQCCQYATELSHFTAIK